MPKILTTDALVTTALRRAMIPSDQSTFTSSDIRDIMNEEIGIHVLPMIMRAHEEYSVIDEDVPLESGKSQYKIPYRAVGNKLREVQFVDSTSSHYEMTRISIEDRPEFQDSYTSSRFLQFYLQDDNVVLTQNQRTNGSLRMSYYIRPNTLVEDNRAGIISSQTNEFGTVTITDFTNLVSGTADTVTIAGVVFTAQSAAVTLGDATFQSATSTDATATSLAAQINAHSIASSVTASASSSVVTITGDTSTYDMSDLAYTDNDSNVGLTVSDIQRTFTLTAFPTHFSTTTVYDFVKGTSPNKIMAFDKTVASTDSTALTVTFNTSELQVLNPFDASNTKTLELSVGDYIMKKEEAIVPQIPTELHPILSQRTAVKMLEALGDTEGMRNAQTELERMEYNAMTLIDARAEGSPQKIRNKHSTLRSAIRGRSRRGL